MYISQVKRPLKLLKKPKLFWEFYFEKPISIIRYKLTGTKKQYVKIDKKVVISLEEANKMLYDGLISDKPFAVMRTGAVESRLALNGALLECGAIKKYDEDSMKRGQSNAGVFPAEESTAEKFTEIYTDAMTQADLAVYWGHILCEKYFIRTFMKNATLIPSRSLEPFFFDNPWTKALEGKKVLVIHPFEKTINSQFENRDKIFENKNILPDFELKTIKAVQSSAGQENEFETWVDALEYMKSEIDKIDFDIALLGCGGYAVPLAAYIKRKGKKAVVLGGLTQLFFGIKGARWEASRLDIVAMYNECWVRASENEKPINYKSVESGAYW